MNVVHNLMRCKLRQPQSVTESCEFCPNSVDTSVTARISSGLFHRIASELGEIEYAGKTGLYFRNEPFIDKSLNKHVKLLRDKCQQSYVYTASNGDLVTVEKLKQVLNAGMSSVTLSAYDGIKQALAFNYLAKQFVSQYPSVNHVSGRRDIDDET